MFEVLDLHRGSLEAALEIYNFVISIAQNTTPVTLYGLYAGVVLLLLWFITASRKALSGPLSNIPGPELNRWSSLPLLVAELQHRKVYYVHALHEKFGPCVRISPNEVAFSAIKDVKAIHKMGSGFQKSPFYAKLQLRGTLLCIINSKAHAERRKHFAKAFSRQNLLEWEGVLKRKVGLAIARVKREGRESAAVDLLPAFTAMATDIIGELCFGDTAEAAEIGEDRGPSRVALLTSIRSELLVPGSDLFRHLPIYLRPLPPFLKRWALRSSVFSKSQPSKPLSRSQLSQPASDRKPTILTKALTDNELGIGLSDEILVKEAKAFVVAGTDTTAVTATYLIWAVLKHPDVKARLQGEVDGLPQWFKMKDMQDLGYLQCVINETLRLYGSVSGSLPRTTQRGGREVGGYFVPEGVIVSTQSFTVHREEAVFLDPGRFFPDRWESPTLEMKESFMPFSVGARACIGMQLAHIELALVTVLFFRECPNVKLDSTMKDMDMEAEDNFVMCPKGHQCIVVL